jgi:hypothetical protein
MPHGNPVGLVEAPGVVALLAAAATGPRVEAVT